MKLHILFATVAAALVLATSAFGQPVGLRTIVAADTNNIAAASTNVYSFNCEEYDDVALHFDTRATGANTGTFEITAFRSLGRSVYETAPFFSRVVTNNGTSQVLTIVPLRVEGATVVRLTIANTNSVGITNTGTSMILINRKAPKESVFATSQ